MSKDDDYRFYGSILTAIALWMIFVFAILKVSLFMAFSIPLLIIGLYCLSQIKK